MCKELSSPVLLLFDPEILHELGGVGVVLQTADVRRQDLTLSSEVVSGRIKNNTGKYVSNFA